MFIPIVGGAILLQIVTLSFLNISKKRRPKFPASPVLHINQYDSPTVQKEKSRKVA